MNRHPLRSAQRPFRANPVRRNVVAPYGSRPRRAASPGSDSGHHSGENPQPHRQDRRLVPLLTEVKSNIDQIAAGVERDMLLFVTHARAAASQQQQDREALRVAMTKIDRMEKENSRLKDQIVEVRRAHDKERQDRSRLQRELDRMFGTLRKVGAYCSKNGADPRCIYESSTEDIPRETVDNFLDRLCPMDPIMERDDKNSTRDSILLSGAEETCSEEGSHYNLRERRSRKSRERSGRRSRSVNPERSRSRPRKKRRSSVDVNDKENVFTATTTVAFNPATGEPTHATATLCQERANLRAERENQYDRVKSIAMDFGKQGVNSDDAPSAPPATRKNTSGGIMASLGQTPSMQRNMTALVTPPSVPRVRSFFEPLKHYLVRKSLPILGKVVCQVCGDQIKKTMMKCSQCAGVCHEECSMRMPLPCTPAIKTSNYPTNDLRYFVTDRTPMLPALVVHCVNEIQARGLNELGLYRINGSTSKVEELYERYMHAIRGNGYPPLCQADMPVLCSLLKNFFKKLDDTLIPAENFQAYIEACANMSAGQCPEELKNLVRRLPRANRDTLAYMILHLKKVGKTDAVKMPIPNLAKVFGPTIVGSGEGSMTHMKGSVGIMEALLNAPDSFYHDALSDNSPDGSVFRMGSSSSFYGSSGLGPLSGYSTVPRNRRLQGIKDMAASATKSRIFASPCLAD